MANFYALLIGIDHYQPNPHFNSLRGAVRDIDKVAAYLDTSLKIPSEQITRLTSPLPDTNSLADARAARQEQPPTYQNIVNAFKGITEGANTGDLVYIHYSGHGGRVKTIFSDLKGEGQFDECLVPMDVGDKGYYLRDVEMNTLLKRMTDKGLVVTVIFDSCHSGGATRGDGDVRGARDGQVDTNDRPQDSRVADRAELLANWCVTTQNSSTDGWLPNRKDYVFLGACRPTELAYEAAFGTGTERNGALTYWMLDTLNAVPTGLTYQALYDRVTGQIQSKFPNQLPMLLGEGDRLVFGSEIKPVQYSLTVVNVMPGQVTLNGGLVQGLSRGARFALYPVGSDFVDKQKRLAVVEIIELQASTATAKILTAEESGVAAVMEQIEPGLPAVMESEPINLKHRVRLFSKEVGEKEEQLPPELVDKQAAALDRVRQAMQSNGWVIEVEGDESGHYQVAVGRKGEYEISRLTPIDNLTPTLSIDDPESADLVVKRLVHLAKYKSIEALDNPESKLSIEFELLDENKQPFPDRNNIKLKSGTVYLRVKNNDVQPLNIAILDLEATWEISSIPIQGGNTVFYELDRDQSLEMPMDFQVPEGDNYQNKLEKIKLFATKGIANFKWLNLPPLDEEAGTRGVNLNLELQQIVETRGVTRGAKLRVSPLNQLLSQIGADVDEPPQISRSVKPKPTPNADWITKTIGISFQK
jgi:Caspase domain